MGVLVAVVVALTWAATLAQAIDAPPRVNYTFAPTRRDDTGFSGALRQAAPLPANASRAFGVPEPLLYLDVEYVAAHTARLTFWSNASGPPWRVPGVLRPTGEAPPSPDQLRFRVDVQDSPFALRVWSSEGAGDWPIFDLDSLFLAQGGQFLHVATALPPPAAAQLVGLGERVAPLVFDRSAPASFSFFASDQGTPDKLPLYGSHPFYMQLRATDAHGVFLLNSNALDVVVSDSALAFQATGGVLDLFLHVGPRPADVLAQRQALIGRPMLPPLWALGFHQARAPRAVWMCVHLRVRPRCFGCAACQPHLGLRAQCRWGYKSLDDVKAVVEGFNRTQMPLDAAWIDIDYMDDYKVFTTSAPFAGLRSFADQLHSGGRSLVLIVDPGVKIQPGYAAYEQGVRSDVFMRDPTGANYTVAQVWPGYGRCAAFVHQASFSWPLLPFQQSEK